MYPTKYAKERPQQQHCTACNAYVKFSTRYPTYICKRCSKKVTDKKGVAIQFFVAEQIGRRVIGKYRDSGEEYFNAYCYIDKLKFQAEEAYLGGVVIYPVETRKRKKKTTETT